MRRAAWLAVGVLVFGACTDGSSDSAPQVEHVPIPQVSLPSNLSFDKAAWLKLWRETPGTRDERCLDVGRRTNVRSGAFVAGNFVSFARGWDGTEANSKLYYIPLHPDPPAPLAVTATRLTPDRPLVLTLEFGKPNAWTLWGAPFYPTGTVLPERGRWRLKAVAGQNRGCFEFQL